MPNLTLGELGREFCAELSSADPRCCFVARSWGGVTERALWRVFSVRVEYHVGPEVISTDIYPQLERIVRIRSLVGFLGEKAQSCWWPTSFFEPPSRGFLEPAFAKTWKYARYQGVVEAARRLHDERLSVGCFHLFRLPEELEQSLHETLRSQSSVLDDPGILGGKHAAIEALRALGAEDVKAQVGPIQIGSIDDVGEKQTFEKIAGIYAAAIVAGHQVFPYLST